MTSKVRARRPHLGRQRSRLLDELGSALPELAIAMLVFSVAILGVVASMGLGMQAVGSSRQRSSGVGVATERLERIHDIPYERIATYEEPKHNSDPDHPDHNVSVDSTTYTLPDGSVEDLIVDLDDGALAHIDDPIVVGNTEFSVFQYVTAGPDLDDPPDGIEDSRRVSVVVAWKFPVQSGTVNRAVQSAIITPGTVTVPTPSPTPLPTAPAPTATPTSCSGGLGGMATGTMEIISGSGAQQGFTDSTSVQVTLDPADDSPTDRAELSNGSGFFTAVTWDSSDPDQVDENGQLIPVTVTWTVPAGDGTKTIQARFRGTDNECSDILTDSVTLDQTSPDPAPANLVASSCTLSGQNRDVTMTWSSSSDANLLGYRLYRSIDSGPFEAISTVGSTSASDSTAKNHNSVRYMVRAYDKAGNESDDSNTLSFAKNSC